MTNHQYFLSPFILSVLSVHVYTHTHTGARQSPQNFNSAFQGLHICPHKSLDPSGLLGMQGHRRCQPIPWLQIRPKRQRHLRGRGHTALWGCFTPKLESGCFWCKQFITKVAEPEPRPWLTPWDLAQDKKPHDISPSQLQQAKRCQGVTQPRTNSLQAAMK